MSRILVIDQFHPDPDALRKEALASEFYAADPEVPWFLACVPSAEGLRLKGAVERALGQPIYDVFPSPEPRSLARYACGCQGARDAVSIHTDPYMMAALVYLHPSPPVASGTCFYRHRLTRRAGRLLDPEGRDLRSADPLDVSFELGVFETVLVVPNVYNRLLVYDATRFHSVDAYFGEDLASGRLTQQLFFNLGRNRRPTSGF